MADDWADDANEAAPPAVAVEQQIVDAPEVGKLKIVKI